MTEREQLKLFDLPNAPSPQKVFSGIDRPLWTEHKAQLISRYLYYFVLITRHGVYIDGFAGPQIRTSRMAGRRSWSLKANLDGCGTSSSATRSPGR